MGNDWIGLLVGVPLLAFLGGRARRLIVKNAPFYATSNIIIVGGLFGLVAAGLAHWLTWPSHGTYLPFGILAAWGLLGALYLGYRPDPIDHYNKAGQTAVATAGVYVLALLVLAFV